MIVDTLSQSERYSALHPLFDQAFAHIKSLNFDTLPYGKYEVQGKDIFFMWGENELRKPENALLEVHDKYIDIQVIVSGTESFGWANRDECKVARSEFDEQKDILFYDDAPSTYVTLTDGQFIILHPDDAHAPLVGQGKVRKCIVKVIVEG